MWPHGVAVEHTLVRFSECLSSGSGDPMIPWLSQLPAQANMELHVKVPKSQPLQYPLLSSAQWVGSSGTSSLKYILGPNQPVPSASGLVWNPGHRARPHFTLGPLVSLPDSRFQSVLPQFIRELPRNCDSNRDVLSLQSLFCPEVLLSILSHLPSELCLHSPGRPFKGQLPYT